MTNAVDPGAVAPAFESVAATFLAHLKSRGIDDFFINAGTDFAPIVEAYARHADGADGADGGGPLPFPTPVLAGHEHVCMGMAHGAYLMTGRPQAVMFHVNVGSANALCGAMNAMHEGVPLLICAGRSPIFEGGALGSRNTRVAWGQEMYDQAGILRESVKWEYELRGALQIDAVLDRALTIARTEPRGPVYLNLPREVLAAPPAEPFVSAPRVAQPTSAWPDPVAVARLADALTDARLPVIAAMASGIDPATVPLLAALCERHAIGYAEEQARYLNLPDSHALHLGQGFGPLLQEADAWLFLEADVPWIPANGAPRADACVAQAGVDPNFGLYPLRSHRSDLAIQASPRALLMALDVALEERRGRVDPARRARLVERARRVREQVAAARTAELGRAGPITPAFLAAQLGQVLHQDCVLFNEYWAPRNQFTLDTPGSYFYLTATGGLGWALPAALGARRAAPGRTMVAAIGDGTYMFSNPTACHHASQKHGLPVLTVIANNARWNAVDSTSRLVYPDGHMTRRAWQEVSDLRPASDFAQVCAASGGYGVTVSERAELADALRAALAVVERDGRQALVNVLCT